MREVIVAGIVILALMFASTTSVLMYESECDTTNWQWYLDNSGLQIFIGFDEEEWQRDLDSLDISFDHLKYFDEEKEIPILIYLGERPTGGYEVNIDRIVKENENTIITISRRSPGPGQYVTMAFTNPYTFLLLPREKLVNENVVVVDQDGQILMEFLNAFPNEERQMRKVKIYF